MKTNPMTLKNVDLLWRNGKEGGGVRDNGLESTKRRLETGLFTVTTETEDVFLWENSCMISSSQVKRPEEPLGCRHGRPV